MLTNKELRKYSRFIYQHVNRYDFGWKDKHGKTRVTKEELLRCKRLKTNKGMLKLNESRLRKHLDSNMTYYYSGHRNPDSPFLLLCIDIDAHNGESDALAISSYITNTYFKEYNTYSEKSTGGSGIHLYFRICVPEYTTSVNLHECIKAFSNEIQTKVSAQGFQAKVCGIYGLPSIWLPEPRMAQIIKLPRPQDPTYLQALLSCSVIPLHSLLLFSNKEVAHSTRIAPGEAPATIKKIDNITNVKNRPVDLAIVRGHNPLYRASWTVGSLASILNRTPTLDEALNYYDEMDLGTGIRTQKRIHRFEKAIEYNLTHFRPDKRRSFTRLYPVILKRIQDALKSSINVSLTYGTDKRPILIEWLAIAYYSALYQLKAGTNGFPIVQITGLANALYEKQVIKRAITNQQASACRIILTQLNLLKLEDNEYTWGRGDKERGCAKKYSLVGEKL